MEILKLITALRNTDSYIEDIFTRGSCYRFHLFLKELFPECEPCMTRDREHVVTLYKGSYYDITGLVAGKDCSPFKYLDKTVAENWSFRKNMSLQVNECPVCEEPIVI